MDQQVYPDNSLRLLRIDYAFQPLCAFKKTNNQLHRLTSNIGRVFVDSDGREGFIGPQCLQIHSKLFINSDAILPDLTSASAFHSPVRIGNGGSGSGGKSTGDAPSREQCAIERNRAVSYLMLRCGFLGDFDGARYEVFDKYYVDYINTGELERNKVNHILKAERKCSESDCGYKFSFENLSHCRAIQSVLIQRGDNVPSNSKPFVSSMIHQLKNALNLSPAQISVLNSCLKLTEKHELNSDMFIETRTRLSKYFQDKKTNTAKA